MCSLLHLSFVFPLLLCFFPGVLDLELSKLYNDFPGTRAELPEDDAPFEWAPGVQLACDFDVAEVVPVYLDEHEPSVGMLAAGCWVPRV